MAPKNLIKKLLSVAGIDSEEDRRQRLRDELIRHEAKIGGTLFGETPSGIRREFFCLDEHTWIWYEQWRDESGSKQSRTTKYSVRPSGILKSQNGSHYQKISDAEALKLLDAARAYEQKIDQEIYGYAASG